MGTSHAEGEALRRLIERIEALERIVPANLEGDELDRRNGEYVNLNDLREVLSAARLAPLSGPVDASGESCAYAECVWPKCREYGGYITNPLCSKRTSAPAAAVPSSPAQEQLRETVDAFLTVLKCSDGLEGAFDAAVEKMTVALRRDVLSDRAIWSGFEPPTTAGADPAPLYRTELPNKRTDDASAIITGPQVRERVDRNTGAEMIALKAAYIEGFHAARETDGNSAFEAWLHSAAKLNVARPPSSTWLPIESAPKDGSRILAKDNYDDETVVFWSHGRNEWRLNIGGFHEDTKHDFTYWMPLHTAVALPPSSPVADPSTRSFWVMERPALDGDWNGAPMYWDGGHAESSTRDIHKAVQWCRKADLLNCLKFTKHYQQWGWTPVEHGIMAPARQIREIPPPRFTSDLDDEPALPPSSPVADSPTPDFIASHIESLFRRYGSVEAIIQAIKASAPSPSAGAAKDKD